MISIGCNSKAATILAKLVSWCECKVAAMSDGRLGTSGRHDRLANTSSSEEKSEGFPPCMKFPKPILPNPAQSCSMLTTQRWASTQRFVTVYRYRAWRVNRYQSTVSPSASTISPALLARAQALAAEHAELSKQLNSEYDARIAKKAGSLSAVASALNGWESASNVRSHAARHNACSLICE